jgi:hypothetical protein
VRRFLVRLRYDHTSSVWPYAYGNIRLCLSLSFRTVPVCSRAVRGRALGESSSEPLTFFAAWKTRNRYGLVRLTYLLLKLWVSCIRSLGQTWDRLAVIGVNECNDARIDKAKKAFHIMMWWLKKGLRRTGAAILSAARCTALLHRAETSGWGAFLSRLQTSKTTRFLQNVLTCRRVVGSEHCRTVLTRWAEPLQNALNRP